MRVLLALFLLLAQPALAQQVVLGLSKDEIGITAFFDGSEIFIYGAIKHDGAIDEDTPLQVAIAIASPRSPVTVRRKEKRFGIWVNVDAVEVDLAPSFYAVATSAPFHDVVADTEDLRHHISVEQMIRSVGAPMDIENAADFSQAVIRIRQNAGLYQMLPGAVTVREQSLFSTSVTLPANLVEGAYTARIFLTRSGQVVSTYETQIEVKKVGIERWLYNLAHQNPVAYGLLSLAIAIFAGWAAAAVFRFVRG